MRVFVACGLTERKLGAAERKFHKEALQKFVSPLRTYLNTEMAAMQREKRILDTKRLDLDVAKNRVRKCTKPAELPVSSVLRVDWPFSFSFAPLFASFFGFSF